MANYFFFYYTRYLLQINDSCNNPSIKKLLYIFILTLVHSGSRFFQSVTYVSRYERIDYVGCNKSEPLLQKRILFIEMSKKVYINMCHPKMIILKYENHFLLFCIVLEIK